MSGSISLFSISALQGDISNILVDTEKNTQSHIDLKLVHLVQES